MRARIARLLVLCTAAASPLIAQSPIGEMKVTPVSDFHPDWLSEGVVSPNGRFFVVRSYAGDAFLHYDRVTKKWSSARGVELGRLLRWSPNGRFLTFVRSPENQRDPYVWVLPIDSATGLPNGTARRISTRPGISPAWSPDGRRIAFVANASGRMRLMSVPFNGGDEDVLFEGPGGGNTVDWSADGKSVLAAYSEPGKPPRRVRVSIETKRADFIPLAGQPRLWLSPDGTRFADYDAATSRLVVTSAVDGRPLQTLRMSSMIKLIGWSHSSPNEIWALDHVTPSVVQRVSTTSGEIRSITPVDSGVMTEVRYSPDGKQFAFARTARGIAGLYVANDDGSNVRRLGTSPDIARIAWSPSSKQIAYITLDPVGSIRVVDVASGSDRELVRAASANAPLAERLRWRNDGLALRYLLAPRGAPALVREAREVGLDGKQRVLVKFDKPSPPAEAHFINDTLLILRERSGVKALDLRSGAVHPLYTGPMRGQGEFGISPDGNWIVFGAENGENAIPRLVSLVTGETRTIPYALSGELADMVFHPDGRHVVASACTTCNAGVEKWDIVMIPMNGDPPRVLTASEASYKDFGSLSISPDGKSIIFEAEQSYNTRIVTLTIPKP